MERKSIPLEAALGDSAATLRVREAIAAARMYAMDPRSDDGVRARSIGLMGREIGDRASDIGLLCGFLVPPSSPRVQLAALERLRGLRLPEVARETLARWTRYSPGFRPSVVGLLLTREEWTRELLHALKDGNVASGEIPPSERQRLLQHKSVEFRDLASASLRRTDIRGDVLEKYASAASLEGAADHGSTVFEKSCAQCHAYRGRGYAVGPNLAEFAGKSAQDFVVAILDPNSAINPNFLAYNIATKDGRVLSGIIKGETASGLTLVQSGGVEEGILRDEMTEIRASQISLMPEGLEQAITPQELADLIAWIKKSTPAPFGGASSGQMAKARSEFLKDGGNPAFEVVACVERLPYPSWMGRLPLAYCRQTEGQNRLAWRASLVSSPRSSAKGETSIRFQFPAAMGFVSQPKGKFTLTLNGKSVVDFDASLADQTWTSADGKVRMDYRVMESNSEDSNGVLVIEAADDLFPAGKPAEFEVTGSDSNSQRWLGLYLMAE